MDNLVLIKYNRSDVDSNVLEEEKYYSVYFEKPKASVIYPGPKYIKRGKPFNDVIEYYSEALTYFDKESITMRYKGSSRSGEHMFEIDITQIIRGRKLDDILGKD